MQRTVKGAVAIVFMGIMLSGCGQKSADEFIATAQTYMQENNNEAAIIELKNAIAAAPNNPEPRLLISSLYIETGELQAAEKELNQALANGADPNQVFPSLAFALYHSEQLDATISLNERIGNLQADKLADVNFYQYLASVQVTQDLKAKNETELFNSLNDSDKKLAQAYQQLFSGQSTAAKGTLEGGIDTESRQASLNFIRGALAFQETDYVSAANNFESVKDIVPFPNSINFRIVESHIRAKQFDQAKVWLDELFEINKDHPMTNYYKAQFAYRDENYEDASRFAEVAVQNNVDTTGARVIAAVSAYRLASYERAYRHLRNIKEIKGFENDDIQRLLAQVQVNLGYVEEAQESLRSISLTNTQDAGLFAEVGVLLAAGGDLSSANSLFEQAQALDEKNVSLKMRQAMLNIGSDETKVIKELTDVVEQEPENSWGWMQLATALVRNGQSEQAINLARRWQAIDELNGKILEAFVLTEIGEASKSIEILNALAESFPNEMGVKVSLLKAMERVGNYEPIYEYAKSILAVNPTDDKVLLSLINASEALKKHDETTNYLKSLSKENGDAVEPLVALAIDARNHNNPQEAIAILTPYKDRLTELGKMTFGDALFQARDYQAAMDYFQQWVTDEPNAAVANLRLIGMYELVGDNEKALQLTEGALIHIPSSNVLKLLQINYLTKLNKIDRAKALLRRIKQNKLSAAEGVTLSLYEGQLALIDMNYEEAVKLIGAYHEKSPTFLSSLLLAKALVGVEQPDKAKETLEAILPKLDAVLPRMQHVLAEFYLQNDYLKEAADYYSVIIESSPEDIAALNNLAYVRGTMGEFEKAKAAASRAYELAPGNPFIMDTLGWIEFKMGNTDAAFTLIRKASELVPTSSDIALHLAEIYISMGQNDLAKLVLSRLPEPSEEAKEKINTL